MKIYATNFKDNPTDLSSVGGDVTEKFHRLLSDAISADNLLVLAGSGASLVVVDSKGKSVLPSMGDLWNVAKGEKDFAEVARIVGYDITKENIEGFLSRCESSLEFISKDDKTKVENLLKVIRSRIGELCGVVNPDTELDVHETFLRKLVRRNQRKTRTKIFTTNYDKCFEFAASKTGMIPVDGFSHVIPQKYDPIYFTYDFVRRDDDEGKIEFLPNVFQLLKLHGSIDWARSDKTGEVHKEQNCKDPLIIYPHDGKFKQSFELPYLDIISDFQRSLRKNSTTIIVCGFGFNDDHLSNMIDSAVRTNGELKIIVVNRTIDINNKYISRMKKLIEKNDCRIMLVEGTFEDFSEHLPYVMLSHTEEELHNERTSRVIIEGLKVDDQKD
ncbi:SIR2 family protein [Candidatus Roizmanbacteria bacterium]|nr:SIR2 family protein [Candidatus Roizmanbacteria bacterium]